MYNPIRISRAIKSIFTDYGIPERMQGHAAKFREQHLAGDDKNTCDAGPIIYQEFSKGPAAFRTWIGNTKYELGQDCMWGRNKNEKKYVEEHVIPKLKDHDYLSKLPKGTVGELVYRVTKDFGIEDPYNRRFDYSRIRERGRSFLPIGAVADIVRANFSRHILLSHDTTHAIYNYDTNIMGEACVQRITATQYNYFPPAIFGWLCALRTYQLTKDPAVWKVWKEAKRIAKEADPTLGFHSPIEFFETPVEEVRKRFNVGDNPEYQEFAKRHHNFLQGNTIHPHAPITVPESI